MKRPLVVALCARCGGRAVDTLVLPTSLDFEYVGLNLCLKLRCPRRQVCAYRCTKHNRSFDLDPTKPRAVRTCVVCGANAQDLAASDVDLHTYRVEQDVEAFLNAFWDAPPPVVPAPKPTRSKPLPRVPVRLAYRRPKRRKRPKAHLNHPFHPVVDLSISDSDE
ncbi:hypothetical protein DYB28_007077 [Aphanomyces astaci]|uniref:Uncharacterized protein n=1 Tax=Aphanomyces astaci TaxID=112090 RepID=A0A9X8H836_APHAT|nr:hypothetical protein DYB28_007077 [Aphanomyces astaci]